MPKHCISNHLPQLTRITNLIPRRTRSGGGVLLVAILSCTPANLFAGTALFEVNSFWIALLGLWVAVVLAGFCVHAIRKAVKVSPVDGLDVWKSLAENVAEAVLMLDNQGRILYCNRDEILDSALIGRMFESLLSEPDAKRWRAFFTIEHKSNCQRATFRIRNAEGDSLVWEVRLTPLEGGPLGASYLACCRDVTETNLRIIAQSALYKISLAASRADSLQDLLAVVVKQLGKITDVSNYYFALYDSVSGRYAKPRWRDNGDSGSIENYELDLSGGLTEYVRATGQPLLMNDDNRQNLREVVGIKSQGPRAACWLGIPLRTHLGVAGVLVLQSYSDGRRYTLQDVPLLSIVAGSVARAIERQRSLSALKQREANLSLLTERLPALIWSEDASGKVTHVSGAALGAVGMSPGDFLGRAIQDVVPLKFVQPMPDRQKTTDDPAPKAIQIAFANRFLEGTFDPVFDDKGNRCGGSGVALDVTDRELADRELRRFFEISADCYLVTDKHGRPIHCNDAFLNLIERTWDEFKDIPLEEKFHPDDLPAMQSNFIALLAGIPTIGNELRMRTKSGDYRWVSWNAILGDDGLLYASGKDITRRREMEMALREREDQLRLFIRNSPAALAMFDLEMRYVVCSDRWLQDYNLGERKIIGQSHYEVFPEIGDEWKAVHKRCMNGATESCQREPFMRADGSTDWVRWVVKPWYRGDDTIGGIIMFTEVITAQVRAESEIEHSRKLAQQIVDSSLDAVIAIDAQRVITEWNPQAAATFGYTREEAIGHVMDDLIVPERYRDVHHKAFIRALHDETREPISRQVKLPATRKDGSEITVELSIGTIDAGGNRQFSAFIRDVTEREERERELLEHRVRLAEAQRIAKLGFWDWDVAKNEMQISKEKIELYDRPDLTSPISFETFLNIVHPDDRHLLHLNHQEITNGKNHFEMHYRIVRPSGEIRYALSQGEAVRDESGNFVRLFGTTFDETDRVLAEARLKASEQRLALALEGSSDGFWDWNMVTGDCYCSPRIVEWLECDPAQFVHHESFLDSMMRQEDLAQFDEALSDHIAGKIEQLQVEECYVTPKGNQVWLLTRAKVQEWSDDGKPLRAAGTCTNITQRKNFETRAAQLGQLLENSINEVLVIDLADFKILEANKRATDNTGYSIDEIRGLTIQTLMPDQRPLLSLDYVQPLLRGEVNEVRAVCARLRKDGTTYPVEHVLQIMDWNNHKVIVSFGTDITARLEAENELNRLESQLRHAQRLETIGTLAGGIAHDFNNILTPILGYADMVAADLEPGSRGRRDIDQVIQAAYRAKDLVQQILAFSRQSGQAKQPLRIDLIVKETLNLLRVSLPPNVELTQNIHCVGNVLSEPIHINQIVMNLCTNASQAIGPDDGTIGVTLTYENVAPMPNPDVNTLAPGDYAVLTVSDSGSGMDEDTLARVFEPFFTTKEVGHGTGLGLSVVHGIVAAHAGAIRIQSAIGKGTRVTVWLPLHNSHELAAVDVDSEAARGTEHVVLCDDDETIVLLGKEMLESFGYKVTALADPVAALAALQEATPRPDAMVVDDIMPILRGKDVALSAHDFDPNLPVILLSGSAIQNPDPETGCAVLTKPTSALALAQAVRDAIDRSHKTLTVQE